jgi:hypothetical protein
MTAIIFGTIALVLVLLGILYEEKVIAFEDWCADRIGYHIAKAIIRYRLFKSKVKIRIYKKAVQMLEGMK